MKKDGGQAFPVAETAESFGVSGMTLRDYFAARAMQGMIALGSCSADEIPRVVMAAYGIADVMIAEREKP